MTLKFIVEFIYFSLLNQILLYDPSERRIYYLSNHKIIVWVPIVLSGRAEALYGSPKFIITY